MSVRMINTTTKAETEIAVGAFVYQQDKEGQATYCEWEDLTPEQQDTYSNQAKQMQALMDQTVTPPQGEMHPFKEEAA